MSLSAGSRRRGRWFGVVVALFLVVVAIPYMGTPIAKAAGDIHISVSACPPGFDVNNAGFDDFVQNCTSSGGQLTFDVSVNGAYHDSYTAGDSGEVTIQGVPNGLVYIKDQTPEFTSSIAFCTFYKENENPPGYAYFGDQGVTGQMGDDDLLDCLWFLTPFQTAETTTVTINKRWCPEGYDAYDAGFDNLVQNCQESYGGTVSFVLYTADGSQDERTLSGQGLLEWVQAPVGGAALDEDIPDGYGAPRAFCQTTDSQGTVSSQEEFSISSDGVLQVMLEVEHYFYCDWFNIPGEAGEIVIVKHWCPEGYTAPHDLDELYQNCHDTYDDPVLFELFGSSFGSAGAQETGDVMEDGIHFVGLPFDTWTVTERVPEGRGIPIVYCKAIDLQSGDESDVSEATIYEGSSIVWPMESGGLQLYCDWFNTGERTGTGVYVRKHVCPEGYQPEPSYDALMVECMDEPNDIEFTVTWPGGDPWRQSTSGEQLNWEGLPPGEIEISETLPQGYGPPTVHCSLGHYLEGANDYEEMDVTDGGSLEWELTEGQYLECDWFNVPGEAGPATLTIVKYLCPEEYDVFDWDTDPQEDCDEEQDDVVFRLSNEGGDERDGTTGDDGDGTVVFDEVEPGVYLLTEEWPEDEERDLLYAFVSDCESTARDFAAYPFDPFVMIGWQSSIRIELAPDEELTCAWYDVPAKEEELTELGGGDATITIVKYDCPGTNVNPSSCDPGFEGVLFELEPADGDEEPIEVETGEDGTVEVSVPAGDYELIELDDDPCFASSDAFDADGFIAVESGDAVEVQVYNCGR